MQGPTTEAADLKTPGDRFTAKDELFNQLELECGDTFPGGMSSQAGQVMILVNAVWFTSGNMATIQEGAAHMADVKYIPERFLKYDDANQYKKKKHKKPQLSSKDLKLQSQCLFGLITRPFTPNWILKSDIEALAVSLDSYARYLDIANEKQQSRQMVMEPVRQIDADLTISHRQGNMSESKDYLRLDNAIATGDLAFFEPLYFDEEIHTKDGTFRDPKQRFRFFETLAISQPIHMLRYDPGGGVGILNLNRPITFHFYVRSQTVEL